MDSGIAVAVAQFAPGTDSAANLLAIRDLAVTAASRGARVVVFPEYSSFFEPVLGPASVAAAEPLDGEFVAGVAAVAKVLGVHIVAGMIEPGGDARRIFNTLVTLDPSGDLIASYRKVHLYDAFGQRESDVVMPGPIEDVATFAVDDVVFGLQTCYDLRFPEVARRVADAGAHAMLLPSEWVRGALKEHHWRTLVTARAIENTFWVVAADHAPPIGAGNSMIVDPMGVQVAGLGESTDVAIAWVSAERVAEVRRVNPSLAMRRFRVVPAD